MPLALHRHRIAPTLLALLAGIFCLIAPRLDRTLGRPFRAHGGDLALAMFLYLGAGVLTTFSARTRAIAILAFMCIGELSQLLPGLPRDGKLVELTIGTTFDPIDLAAYVIGTLLAVWVERFADARAA
jgi:hypothetical protein